VVRLKPPSTDCNCHGWVFLGGHYWLNPPDVDLILLDNGYRPVDSPQSGDLILYWSPWGYAEHSGVVVAVAEGVVMVESKWGDLGCYLHPPQLPQYGRHQFYRSDRVGHLVHWAEPAATEVGPNPPAAAPPARSQSSEELQER
jgi:hypothetical protein